MHGSDHDDASPVSVPGHAFLKLSAAAARAGAVHGQFLAKVDGLGALLAAQDEDASRAADGAAAIRSPAAELSESVGAIAVGASTASALLDSGDSALRLAVNGARGAVERVRLLGERLGGIGGTAGEIADRVGRIADIAVENKVIAINASITASRAGDTVRGFKVIAGEITRLSSAMAERVDAIVQRSARVAERSAAVVAQTGEGLSGTEETLRRIESAFGVLDQARRNIAGADASARSMLAASSALRGALDGLEAALASVRESVVSAAGAARSGEELFGAQRAAYDALAGAVSAAGSAVDAVERVGIGVGPGATLRMAELPIGQFDPALATIVREYHYANFTCIRLLRYSSDLKLVPYLADTWTLSDGVRTWDFSLKRGVAFHDGTELTAEDVKFSFERVMNPALGSPYANLLTIIEGAEAFRRGEADGVSGIELAGSHGIRFRLTESCNFFLGLLAHSFTSIIKKDGRWAGSPLGRDDVVSAGPFRSAPRPAPAVDRLAANPAFLDGPPFYAALEIHRAMDDLPAALASGALDLAYNVPATMEPAIRAAGFRGEARRYASRYCFGICVNFTRDNCLSRSAELRRAAAMAVDKDRAIAAAFGSDAERTDFMLAPSILDMGESRPLPYDPDRARAAFAEGLGPADRNRPLTLAWVRNATSAGVDAVTASVAGDLRAAGLRVSVVELPADAAKVDEYRKYDLVFLRFMPEPDLYAAVEPFINPEGGDNYFHYANPELFGMLRSSIAIQEDGARRTYFRELMERFTLDVFMIPLYFQKVLCLSAPAVRSVYLTVEESFMPEVARPAGEAAASEGGGRAVRAYRERMESLSSAIASLGAGSETVLGTLADLIATVASQETRLAEADQAAAQFAARAGELGKAGAEVSGSVREAAEEARRAAEAAEAILGSLSRLSEGLAGTAGSLEAVKKEIRSMLEVVADIEESNAVIGTVAINAAIIAAKGGAAKGELLKVARAIAELAGRNAENTGAVRAALERMDAESSGNAGYLAETLRYLASSMGGVEEGRNALGTASATLGGAGDGAARVSALAAELSERAGKAATDAASLADGSVKVIAAAETVKYGIEMERAVVEVLRDVGELNRSVAAELSGR